MYIVTEDGEKLTVDNSLVDYDDGRYHPWYQTVAVIDDDTTYARDVWVIELQKSNVYSRGRRYDFQMEWFKELFYDHEPSKDEILAAIIKSGGTEDTIAFVRHGYMIDREYD